MKLKTIERWIHEKKRNETNKMAKQWIDIEKNRMFSINCQITNGTIFENWQTNHLVACQCKMNCVHAINGPRHLCSSCSMLHIVGESLDRISINLRLQKPLIDWVWLETIKMRTIQTTFAAIEQMANVVTEYFSLNNNPNWQITILSFLAYAQRFSIRIFLIHFKFIKLLG